MRRLLPVSLFLLPLLSSCSHSPTSVGVIRLAQEADPTTLDPTHAYDTYCIPFVRVLYRGLVEYDFDSKLNDELAQSHTVSPDGKTYRFVLRPNLRYWDGTPVVAEDFRAVVERALEPATASDGSSFYNTIEGADEWVKWITAYEATDTRLPITRHIKGIEVKGDREIIFHLKQPDATFLPNLSLPFAYAVPHSLLERLRAKHGEGRDMGFDLSEHPMGCGPYKLKSWTHDASLQLEKNPDYFRPDLPKAQAISVQLGIASPLQVMLYEQGALDISAVSDANAPDFLRVSAEARTHGKLLHAPMMDVRYMCMNNEIGPLKDRRVRQAICYAINRDRILAFLTGRASKARGAFPEGVSAYDPNLFSYPYDPAKSRQLLKEANFKSGTIPLLFSTGEPWYGKAAQSIQEDLAEVGIRVDPQPMRYPDLKAKAGTRGPKGTMLSLLGWLQDYPDPSNYLDPLFNKRSIAATSSLNRSFYSNPQVNKLLDEAIKMPSDEARWKKYQEAQRIIVRDAPVVFLHNTQRYIALQPRIQGFKIHPAWSAAYEFVSAN